MTLRAAAEAGGILDVRFLLAAGADAGAENGMVLHRACNLGHLQVAEALIEAGGGALTPVCRSRAMCYAAFGGHTACCKLLLDLGADIHSERDLALCWAASCGHLKTVAFLLDRSADASSELALRWATNHHHHAVVTLLLAQSGRVATQ